MNIDNLESEVTKLKKGLELTVKKLSNSTDEIREQFQGFVDGATSECQALEQGVLDIRNLAKEFAEYFCEDAKKLVLDEYLKVNTQYIFNYLFYS